MLLMSASSPKDGVAVRSAAFLTNRSRLRRKRKAGEREQRERGINNIHCCFHVFIFFHVLFDLTRIILPFTEVLSEIRSEVTRKLALPALKGVKPRWGPRPFRG